jgi:rare lipoprotein A
MSRKKCKRGSGAPHSPEGLAHEKRFLLTLFYRWRRFEGLPGGLFARCAVHASTTSGFMTSSRAASRQHACSGARCSRAAVAAAFACVLLSCLIACGGRKRPRAVVPKIGHSERGVASWYGHPYHGRRAANGEIFDMEKLTAAHRTFTFGTWVRVHNLDNGKTIDVRITDRGPFVDGRIIDLSRAAAREIDMIRSGLAKVRLEVIPAPKISEPRTESAAADPEAIAPPVPVERFAVQVGAYRDRSTADSRRRTFEDRYAPARLIRREGPVDIWRVVVGDFERIEDAESLAQAIRTSGEGEALTVRLDGETRDAPRRQVRENR